MTREEKAIELHDRGFNCCQAVVCAFADELGEDPVLLQRIAEGFGLGMGSMQGTCGALSGAMMLAGLKNADGNPDAPRSKRDTYAICRSLYQAFTDKTGASLCKELKGVETGQPLTPCDDCIRAGVKAAEDVLSL